MSVCENDAVFSDDSWNGSDGDASLADLEPRLRQMMKAENRSKIGRFV